MSKYDAALGQRFNILHGHYQKGDGLPRYFHGMPFLSRFVSQLYYTRRFYFFFFWTMLLTGLKIRRQQLLLLISSILVQKLLCRGYRHQSIPPKNHYNLSTGTLVLNGECRTASSCFNVAWPSQTGRWYQLTHWNIILAGFVLLLLLYRQTQATVSHLGGGEERRVLETY